MKKSYATIFRGAFAISIMGFCVPFASAKTIVRHIFNQSDSDFQVSFSPFAGSISMNCPSPQVGRIGCLIKARTTIEITYIFFGDVMGQSANQGRVSISSCGASVTFNYDSGYIRHDGRTLGMNLNSPTDGDIELFMQGPCTH